MDHQHLINLVKELTPKVMAFIREDLEMIPKPLENKILIAALAVSLAVFVSGDTHCKPPLGCTPYPSCETKDQESLSAQSPSGFPLKNSSFRSVW